MAYSLSNICAKNYQNRLMCVEIIVCYISVVFFRGSVVVYTKIKLYYCSIVVMCLLYLRSE